MHVTLAYYAYLLVSPEAKREREVPRSDSSHSFFVASSVLDPPRGSSVGVEELIEGHLIGDQ